MNKKRKEEIIKIFYEKIDACRLWHKEEIMSALHDYLEGQKITDCDEKIIVKGFNKEAARYAKALNVSIEEIKEVIKEHLHSVYFIGNPT